MVRPLEFRFLAKQEHTECGIKQKVSWIVPFAMHRIIVLQAAVLGLFVHEDFFVLRAPGFHFLVRLVLSVRKLV
jgi:hypothetical protein